MTFFEMFDAAKAGFAKAETGTMTGHFAIQIEVTEDGSGIFYVEATDGILNVQPYDYRDNTAAVTLPNNTLFALLQRETTLPEAVAQGLALVDGCMEAAAQLFAAVVPAPKKATAAKKADAATTAAPEKKTGCKAKESAAPAEKTAAEPVKACTAATAATAKESKPATEEKVATTTTTAPAAAVEPAKTETKTKTVSATTRTAASTKTQPKRTASSRGRRK